MSGDKDRAMGRWGLRERVEFECALGLDERADWAELRERDVAVAIDDGLWTAEDRRGIARQWLEHRKAREPLIKLAADSVDQALRVSGQLLGVCGGLAGIGAATAALAYTGEAPINVSAFFAVFVLLQALMALVLVVAFVLPRGAREWLVTGPVFRVTRFVFLWLFGRLLSLASRFLEGQRRQDAAEMAGAAKARLALHGRLLKWLCFRKVQAAAVMFNLGALLALLISVSFSDRAFGWQTTLDLEAETVGELVSTVAAPWAWLLGESEGYPSAAQIEGSRIVLKEGIQSLDSESLAVWWKFLALGMVCYGVLPRLAFWALGAWQMGVALKGYDFRNAAAERLMERLRPQAARFDGQQVTQADWGEESEAVDASGGVAGRKAVCFFSEELGSICDVTALGRALARRWRLSPDAVRMEEFPRNGFAHWDGWEADEQTQYVIVFESWMPPIKEVERQIRQLRAAVDERSLIKIVLLGIPEGATHEVSLVPAEQYAKTWDAFTRRLGDAYLILDNPR